MISYSEFVNQVENIKPPILKPHQKSACLSGLQGVGLIMLIFFSILIPLLIFDSLVEKQNVTKTISSSIGSFLVFLPICIGGWIGFIYSFKFSRKENRIEYKFKSSTRIIDTIVIVLGIVGVFIVFSLQDVKTHDELSIIQKGLLLGDLLIVMAYFKNKKRKLKRELSKQNIPIYQMLSLFGIKQDINNPNMLKLDNGIFLSFQDLTEKFGYYTASIIKASGDVWKGIVFNISVYHPELGTIKSLKEKLERFILSSTGQDLFFHSQILQIKEEETENGLVLYFITYHSAGACKPNYYEDKYFYYSKEDLLEVYNNITQLLSIRDY